MFIRVFSAGGYEEDHTAAGIPTENTQPVSKKWKDGKLIFYTATHVNEQHVGI